MIPSRSRALLLTALTGWVLTACGGTADATDAAAMTEGTDAQVMIDHLMTQTQTAREKIVGLAEAIPEGSYDWRPGEGVRSVGEVFIHVAADNYLLPAIAGVAAPESTGRRRLFPSSRRASWPRSTARMTRRVSPAGRYDAWPRRSKL